MDVKCSYSRCFRGHNLHPRVVVLCTLSPLSCFVSIIFFFKLKRTICTLLFCNKNIDHHALSKEKEDLFRYRASLEKNLFRCARARAHLRALMTPPFSRIFIRSVNARRESRENWTPAQNRRLDGRGPLVLHARFAHCVFRVCK